MTTFSLDYLAETLVAGGGLVFAIRPPRQGHDNWAVNFRVSARETAWNCGPPFPTIEEAIMDALEKIEAMLANKNISHVSFGRAKVPGPKRFATISGTNRGTYRGTGDTVSEATENAVAEIEKAHSGKRATPVSKAPAAKAEPEYDPLDDLLG